jgi:uncharacterized membrane protein YvlD (DUF360 family)
MVNLIRATAMYLCSYCRHFMVLIPLESRGKNLFIHVYKSKWPKISLSRVLTQPVLILHFVCFPYIYLLGHFMVIVIATGILWLCEWLIYIVQQQSFDTSKWGVCKNYKMLWLSNISKLLTQSTIYSVVLVAKWEELGYTSICGLQPHHRMQEAIVMAQRSIPEWDSELKSLLQLGTSWFEAQKMIQTCPRLL